MSGRAWVGSWLACAYLLLPAAVSTSFAAPVASVASDRSAGGARRLYISDDGLPTVLDVDVLDADILVAAVPEATEGVDLQSAAKLLTKDEARRMAANIVEAAGRVVAAKSREALSPVTFLG